MPSAPGASGRETHRVEAIEELAASEEREQRDAELTGFERLVADLTARFVNIPPENVDAAIVDSQEDIAALQRDPWPGNIRELRNVVEPAMILGSGPRLAIAPPTPRSLSLPNSARLADVEASHVTSALISTGWRVRMTVTGH